MPEHPASYDGWVFEHRVVLENILGRHLEPEETVHHINEDKTFNDPRNLFACSLEEHCKAHR
jgi:hypothetical protein